MKELVHLRVRGPICTVIQDIIDEKVDTVLIEKTKHTDFGDFSTNMAMMYAKKTGMSPRSLAEKLKNEIMLHDKEGFFARIDVAGPGFINFFISRRAVQDLTDHLINDEGYLSFPDADLPPVIVEFVSANPTGPLHVGHGRGAAFGDSVARILRYTGRKVTTEYYINDVGSQMDILGHSLYLRYQEEMGHHVDFPDDHYKGEYVRIIARELAGDEVPCSGDYTKETSRFFSEYGKEKILRGIMADLSEFLVNIDSWFSERTLFEEEGVDATIELLKQKGDTYEHEGALWFRSTKYGDDKDRVLVRANSQKTYFASDIAYHVHKINREYGELIDIWGADHHGYAPRLGAAIRSLGYEEEILKVILVQFVTLIRDGEAVSMSTRAGEFETLRDLLDEVGSDAARFFYLMRSANSHLDFDIDLAKTSTSENPVYYVQYAHARICSLLREADERGIDLPQILSVKELEGDEEVALMKKALEFKNVIGDSARLLEPHRIPFYLVELSKMFHSYYNQQRFLTEDTDSSIRRVALAIGIRKVISKGLELIGVSQPERM